MIDQTNAWDAISVRVDARDYVVYRRADGHVMEVAAWRNHGSLGRRLFILWKPQQGTRPGPTAAAAIAASGGSKRRVG